MTLGTGAFPMALAIVIIDSGGSATTLGLVLAAKMLSGTTFVLAGGVWADRLKRKYVMMAADLSRGFLILILVATVFYLLGSSQCMAATRCTKDGSGGICCWDTETEGPFKPLSCE